MPMNLSRRIPPRLRRAVSRLLKEMPQWCKAMYDKQNVEVHVEAIGCPDVEVGQDFWHMVTIRNGRATRILSIDIYTRQSGGSDQFDGSRSSLRRIAEIRPYHQVSKKSKVSLQRGETERQLVIGTTVSFLDETDSEFTLDGCAVDPEECVIDYYLFTGSSSLPQSCSC